MKTDWSEKILDSFLEEAVTGRRPPDLLATITTAWQQEQASKIPLPSKTQITGELIAPPVVEKLTKVQKQVVSSAKVRTSYAWQVLLVVAASGVLVACAIQWRAAFNSSEGGVVAAKGKQPLPQVPQVASASDPMKSTNGDEGFGGEKLGTENVPFASRNSQAPAEKLPAVESIATSNRLSDSQIVELIDTQLAVLWQRLKITPESKRDDIERAQSLSQTLTGQYLPSTIATDLSVLKTDERREQAISKVVKNAVDSQAFARLWAKELVVGWLRGGNLPLDSAPVEQLEQFVANDIANNRPWNEVVSKVISSDVLVTAFAGGGNHRLASHLSGAFMDSSLGCVRCHDAKGHVGAVASQEQYWSLVATLMGLDVRTDEKSSLRTAIDNQAEVFAETKKASLFFELPDGKLVAAKFVLPDGKSWQSVGSKTPRAALAKWIGDSSQSDQAIVNQVWQIALGRPLVASNSLVDDVGLTERTELHQLLAQQFRAHGRNLSQLVGWVVSSDAFARDAISVDRNRWLQATETDIENWHLAEMTFAARTSLGEQAVKGGLESSLTAAMKWNQTSNDGGTSVLAQPSFESKAKPKSPIKSDIVMPSPGYAIHRGRLSKDQEAYIAGLAASEKLTWEQKVEHVVLLSPMLSASGGVKRLSGELLKSLGDPKAALTELLWAVQNADAS